MKPKRGRKSSVTSRGSIGASGSVGRNGFLRSCLLIVKQKDGTEIRRVTSEVNFKTKDLATLVAALQFLLQSCPKNNLIRFKNLKYLGGGEKTALDNTPFAPARGKKNAEIVVDEGNFSPDVFLAMSKVTLIAEAEVEEELEEETAVNDENNRRLSNGTMQPPDPATIASTASTATGTAGTTATTPTPTVTAIASGGGSPSPPRPLSLASPLGHSQGMRSSVESSGWGGSSWDPSVSGAGPRSIGSSLAARPSVRTLSGSSTVDHARDGDHDHRHHDHHGDEHIGDRNHRHCGDEQNGDHHHHHHHHGNGDERHDSSMEGPSGDGFSPLGSPASATFAAIAAADAAAAAEGGRLASPAPGRQSKLFRRVSRLPRASLEAYDGAEGREDGDHVGGGDGVLNGDAGNSAIRRVDSGVSSAGSGSAKGDSTGANGGSEGVDRMLSGSGDEGGSTDTSSIGRKGGLGKDFGGGRPHANGRRDAVQQEMRPEPRGRGGGRDKDRDKDKVKGTARSGGLGGAGGSRSESTKERRNGKGDASGDTGRGGGVRGGEQPQSQPRTKHRLYPNSGSSTACTNSGASKHRKPAVTPNGKKPHAGSAATPASQAQKNASRATPTTSDSRSKHPVTPKAKVPSRMVAAGTGDAAGAASVSTAAPAGAPARPSPAPKAQIQTGRGGFLSPTQASQSRSRSPRPKAEEARSARIVEESGGGEEGVTAGPVLPPRISVVVPWEKNLRSASKAPAKKDPLPTMGLKKDATPAMKRAMGKGRRGGGGGYGGDFGGGGGGGGMDGRPSIGTWNKTQNYLQILKEISGKDEEELEWLAVAKEGKGVTKSERRQESAETEYHRLLCEESIQQVDLKLLQDRRLEVALKGLSKMGDDLGRLTELLEELSGQESAIDVKDEAAENQGEVLTRAAETAAAATASSAGDAECSDEQKATAAAAAVAAAEAVTLAAKAREKMWQEKERLVEARGEAEAKLSQLLENIGKGKNKLHGVRDVLRKESKDAPATGGTALTTIIGITADVTSARELITPDRARSGLRALQRAAVSLSEKLNKTRMDSQSALGRMEKWRERKEALPEYEQEVAEKERAWFARERKANAAALRRMRALCPVGVTALTVAQLEERAIEQGSLYPRELALRLKENRLLHWTVEHPDDIARSNFLRGDHAHFFTNLDRYDLVELRAITACLPERFEVDGDGRKAAWRAAFLQRVQGLVAQERGDTVSGGWDPEAGCRRTVRLPALAAEQARRPEYLYPTPSEVAERMDKLRERQRKVDARRAKLEEVKGSLLPEARQEYANVLEDTRHPANKAAFPAEDLRRARDEAKAEVDRLAKEAKQLEADLASAERALKEAPYTVESLQTEAKQTKALLLKRAEKRRLRLRAEREQREKDRQERRERRERQAEKSEVSVPGVGVGKDGGGVGMGDAGGHAGSGGGGSAGGTRRSSASGTCSSRTSRISSNSSASNGKDAKEASGEAADAATDPEEDGEGEENREVEVAEGLEVEGAFEPEPELRSRFGDKSNSLRFVTAEEDARMRREELAKVFGARDAADAAVVTMGAAGQPPDVGNRVATGDDDGKDVVGAEEVARARKTVAAMTSALQDGKVVEVAGEEGSRDPDAGLVGGGDARERMKAFGAVLERTMSSNNWGGRAAPLGTTPSGGCGGGDSGPKNPLSGLVGKGRFLSPTRQGAGGGASGGEKSEAKAAVVSPPCKPKSKFFRSIQSPTREGSDSDAAATEAGAAAGPQFNSPLARGLLPPPLPRPPAAQLGLLSEIVSRGGAHGGEKKSGPVDLLAAIRARAGNLNSVSVGGASVGQTEEKEAPITNTTTNTNTMVDSLSGGPAVGLPVPPTTGVPMPPPPPPVGIKPRSLFAAAKPCASGGGRGGGGGAPPLNMFAELKAKAAAREAKRREEGEEV